jgi:hypothetical protein
VDRLINATPRQLLAAAAITLIAAVVVAELVLLIDRYVMARYDPAKLIEEVDEYREQFDRRDDAEG